MRKSERNKEQENGEKANPPAKGEEVAPNLKSKVEKEDGKQEKSDKKKEKSATKEVKGEKKEEKSEKKEEKSEKKKEKSKKEEKEASKVIIFIIHWLSNKHDYFQS